MAGTKGVTAAQTSKRRKYNSTGVLLPAGSTEGLAGCMADNVSVHDDYDLFRKSRDELGCIAIKNQAKLVFLNVGAYPELLKATKSTDQRIANVIYTIRHSMLHPRGTLAFLVPQPWYIHAGRLHDALEAKGMSTFVEDQILTLQYSGASSSVGRPSTTRQEWLRFSQDGVMLVHLFESGATNTKMDGFTVNKRVTTDDLFGNKPSSSRASSSSILGDIEYAGKDTDWPTKAIVFLVNRYSNQGDSIVVFGAERNTGVSTSIQRGRKVEAFVSSPADKVTVDQAAAVAFHAAYSKGIFQAAAAVASEVVIGHKKLPCGLPANNIPEVVGQMLRRVGEANESADSPENKETSRSTSPRR
ncbi:unnamed protein product [Pylaiella littoralis]